MESGEPSVSASLCTVWCRNGSLGWQRFQRRLRRPGWALRAAGRCRCVGECHRKGMALGTAGKAVRWTSCNKYDNIIVNQISLTNSKHSCWITQDYKLPSCLGAVEFSTIPCRNQQSYHTQVKPSQISKKAKPVALRLWGERRVPDQHSALGAFYTENYQSDWIKYKNFGSETWKFDVECLTSKRKVWHWNALTWPIRYI